MIICTKEICFFESEDQVWHPHARLRGQIIKVNLGICVKMHEIISFPSQRLAAQFMEEPYD